MDNFVWHRSGGGGVNYVVSDTIQKVNTVEEEVIIHMLNGVDIYHPRLYVGKHCGSYIKAVIDIHGHNEPVKW